MNKNDDNINFWMTLKTPNEHLYLCKNQSQQQQLRQQPRRIPSPPTTQPNAIINRYKFSIVIANDKVEIFPNKQTNKQTKNNSSKNSKSQQTNKQTNKSARRECYQEQCCLLVVLMRACMSVVEQWEASRTRV
ncbi:conserved hypothetical protein [Trichinella spiralis]|uniref:hypothetical protein n=1 Tax=Trichinella spiralis TaxID=6334 RepID=UPI0001EFB720|nr:conserved hypothetical protein [Trichinella spiralis]